MFSYFFYAMRCQHFHPAQFAKLTKERSQQLDQTVQPADLLFYVWMLVKLKFFSKLDMKPEMSYENQANI